MNLKTIGHPSYAAWSSVHHSIAIYEFKMELQYRNGQFGSKSVIICPVWFWNLTNDLEKNRNPLSCYFKLCTALHNHLWFQNRVTVRTRPNLVKIDYFVPCGTLNFDGGRRKTTGGQLFYAIFSSVHHFITINEFTMELRVYFKSISLITQKYGS